MERVVASIEARMGSGRFPGKVLGDVAGKPALTRLLDRLRLCRELDDIVLATTTSEADDALQAWAEAEGVKFYRGSEDDVLGRVIEAHRATETDIIVELTGDCILTDPEIVDLGVTTFKAHQVDYVSNVVIPGFPVGVYVQVFRAMDLESIGRRVEDPEVREHVSLYFYEHPEEYRLIHILPPARWQHPEYRLCLDYPEDLILIDSIYRLLEPKFGDSFGIEEMIDCLKSNPELAKINSHCEQLVPRS
ncbi:MAG: glycosyltransferase family protein [Cyanobacteria bacterium HKST-UBA02]|nr:glycosyltransferase family protein [Cyanobacteria bacterium HKST-UBA02]